MTHKILISALLLLSWPALAKFTYEGYLTEVDGVTPETSNNVQVRLKVQNPLASCVLYEETQSVDLSASNGYFSVNIGDGSGTVTDYTALGLSALFANYHTALNGQSSCVYNPTAGDSRKILVQVRVDMGAWEDFGSINYHPSENSVNAEKLGKHSPTSLLRVENAGTPAAASVLTPANMTELMNLIAGTSTLYAPPGGSGITALTGDVTASGSGSVPATIAASAVTTAKLADSSVTNTKIVSGAVTWDKLANVNGNTLVGRPAGSPGVVQELSVGGGLNIAAGILSVSNLDAGSITTGILPVSRGGTNTASFANDRIILSNVTGLGMITDTCVMGEILQRQSSNWSCVPAPMPGLALDGSTAMTGPVKAFTGGGASNPGYGFSAAAGNGMFYTGANVIGFATGATERMRIDNAGNMGIGTTTPAANLHLKNTGPATNVIVENNTNGGSLQFVNSGSNGMRMNYNLSASSIELGTVTGGANDSPAMVLKNNGKAGIGLLNPVANLDVMGPGGANPIIRGTIQNTGVGQMIMEGYGTGGTGYGVFVGRGANGSAGTPTQSQPGHKLATFGGSGYTDVSNFSGLAAGMSILADGSFTSTSWPTAVVFFTTPSASTMPAENMRIIGNGNVGIGTNMPAFKLQVNGDIAPTNDGVNNLGAAANRFNNVYAQNGTINTSDRRQKRNIQSSDLGLDFINSLNPVSYKWKKGDENLHYGFIAQELEQAIRQSKGGTRDEVDADNIIVSHDKKTDTYGVKYTELISPIVQAIKELYTQFLSQDQEISRLKKENSAIKAYLCAKDPSAPLCQ